MQGPLSKDELTKRHGRYLNVTRRFAIRQDV
jgi:hypothetical protein